MDPAAESRLPLTPLTMAILLALAEGDRHGYALMQAVESQTEGALTPGTGSLYAALERLMQDGLIGEAPTRPGDDRRRRTYRILPEGQALVRAETERMLRVLRIAQARELTPKGVDIPDLGAEAGA